MVPSKMRLPLFVPLVILFTALLPAGARAQGASLWISKTDGAPPGKVRIQVTYQAGDPGNLCWSPPGVFCPGMSGFLIGAGANLSIWPSGELLSVISYPMSPQPGASLNHS
jgi:hypothetical protein